MKFHSNSFRFRTTSLLNFDHSLLSIVEESKDEIDDHVFSRESLQLPFHSSENKCFGSDIGNALGTLFTRYFLVIEQPRNESYMVEFRQ